MAPPGPRQPYREISRRTQAGRVFTRFGGVRRLAEALRRLVDSPYRFADSVVRRWGYSVGAGTGGRVPAHAMPYVLRAARAEGILLTAEDLDPREWVDA